MIHICEGFTEDFRKEMDDKLYRVVYDDETKQFEIQRYRQTRNGGYYATQRTYIDEPYWFWKALQEFKHGAWRRDNMSVNDFLRESKENREKVNKDSENRVREAGREMAKDIYNFKIAPKVTSIQGVRTTRLKEIDE